MENQFYLFLIAILAGVAVENVVLTRALGLSKQAMFIGSPGRGVLYGAIMTWMVTLSSLLAGLVNMALAGAPGRALWYAPCYYLCVAVVYVGTYLLTRHKLPKLGALIHRALPISAFNTALFGVFYITLLQGYSFWETVGYAFGAGIGYTLALIIIYYARKRLAISPVARSFRGLPILLLYIGFLSLALYGLIGPGMVS